MRFFAFLIGGLMLMGSGAMGNGRQLDVEYLSDLQHRFVFIQQGWGELGIDVSAHAPGQTPLSLRVKDKPYTRGLGHHAPGEILIDLNGEYDTFEAEVGVQWQSGNVGSVVFQVFVDEKKRFDSGVMKERDPARPIRIPVKGAQEMRLVVTDAGDGITCDCANWAEARLTCAPASTAQKKEPLSLDIGQFARVITCDPDRVEGTRAGRVEEFPSEDIFLDSDVLPDASEVYTVPVSQNGKGCISLKWLERRRLMALEAEFAEYMPPAEGARVEAWAGESAWQGRWQMLKGKIEPQGDKWTFNMDWKENPVLSAGVLKIRWIFPPAQQPLKVRRLSAYSRSRWDTVDLFLQAEHPAPGQRGEIKVYNGEIVSPAGSPLLHDWDLSSPLRLSLRYSRPRPWQSDRTVLRFRLPGGAFGVAVEDILANECVYVKEAGLFITRYPVKTTPDAYRRKIARRKTVLERVRRMPDQTFAQAMEKTHHAVQDNGPMLLSLACDNRKFVVQREGAIRFESVPDSPDQMLIYPLKYSCELVPRFGSGKKEELSRHLHGGWLPVPVTTVKEGGMIYRQRTFVAPSDKETPTSLPVWLSRRPLCVAEITIENSQAHEASASLSLSFLLDAENRRAAEWRQVPQGAIVEKQGQLLAFMDTSGAGPLRQEIRDGTLQVHGTLPASGSVRFFVYIPAWGMKAEAYANLRGGEGLLADTEAYWNRVMAPAMHIELPDPLLMNVIRASRVHCLIAARNEEEGKRIAPWIASMVYGPLESEANSIIRGMDFLGHHDFARRSLEFFIHRYNPAGYLTTGYTLMGTGWHLWTLGEHYQLTRDSVWLKRIAPQVELVCRWITKQLEKTRRLEANGGKAPEYGLMPPGVMADWGVYAHYFCLNGYYYAGLHTAAQALSDIGRPGADSLLEETARFKSDINRTYRWAQSLMPVYPLQSGLRVPGYPSQVYCPGPTNHFYPGEDGNRSWAYDVELGAHQLVPQGVLDASSPDAGSMMEHMEDVHFLSEGWFDYPARESQEDWFNLGGFSKVQPYYTRNAEIYALRDDVKPFIRSYFNTIASLLNTENLSFWEHFHNAGAWNKTHETGYFLQQTRFMLVMERGEDLWLAPFVTRNWLKEGMAVSVRNAPTRFGKVSFRIVSSVRKGFIEAVIEPPAGIPGDLVIRLRHPEGKRIRSVSVNGKPHTGFDRAKECICIKPTGNVLTVRVNY